MADPNNIPQEAQQLKEDLNNPEEETSQKAKADIATTDFDKEYDIAKQNETGSGEQSSDPNPVNRKGADAGDKTVSRGNVAGDKTATKGTVDNIDSPGDSDPDDYMDMARDITKNVDAGE